MHLYTPLHLEVVLTYSMSVFFPPFLLSYITGGCYHAETVTVVLFKLGLYGHLGAIDPGGARSSQHPTGFMLRAYFLFF